MKKTNDGIIRLHEGELNVMELLWSNKELAAKERKTDRYISL